MTRVEITRSFRVALDGGNRVVTVEAGTIVEDPFIADVALRGGHGRPIDDPAPKDEPSLDEKAIEAAPSNKAIPRSPRNKGR